MPPTASPIADSPTVSGPAGSAPGGSGPASERGEGGDDRAEPHVAGPASRRPRHPEGPWSAVDARRTAALIDLITELGACGDLARGCHLLATRLQTLFGCDHVVVGWCRKDRAAPRHVGPCRLLGLSHTAKFDKHGELTAAMTAALDDSVIRGEMTVWAGGAGQAPLVPMTHRSLCQLLHSEAIVGSPLRDVRDRTRGAWLLTGSRASIEAFGVLECLRAYEQPIASCLQLLERADPGPVGRLRRSAVRAVSKRRAIAAVVAVVLLLIALVVPVPFRIGCDAVLEPVLRRYVAAPFDGKLDLSLVEPGDLVGEGDVLAKMDGREIEWELAGHRAEYHRAVKRRDAAMARHEAAAAQQAKLEAARLKLKIQLLEQRQKNLEIRSPLTGIVISGDLRRSEGAPLTVGQTLFEVAPLDRMIVELAIPEDEIRSARIGARVTVVIPAVDRTCEGVLERILPRAVVRDGEVVFLGEVKLANTGGELRPGMTGAAKIAAGRRRLGAMLFGPAVEALGRWMGW